MITLPDVSQNVLNHQFPKEFTMIHKFPGFLPHASHVSSSCFQGFPIVPMIFPGFVGLAAPKSMVRFPKMFLTVSRLWSFFFPGISRFW